MTRDDTALWQEALRLGLPSHGALLAVALERQRLRLVRDGALEWEYTVSTSRYGAGNIIDSFKTPTGWHEVAERYGAGEPVGRVFFEREPTHEVLPPARWREDDRKDLITTRILRLRGLEEGLNRGGPVDTYERYIYLHGANHEHWLGSPASHGCIHLGNHDIVKLFDQIDGIPTWCWLG